MTGNSICSFREAPDGKPDRDVVAGHRFLANCTNRVGMVLKITKFCHQ